MDTSETLSSVKFRCQHAEEVERMSNGRTFQIGNDDAGIASPRKAVGRKAVAPPLGLAWARIWKAGGSSWFRASTSISHKRQSNPPLPPRIRCYADLYRDLLNRKQGPSHLRFPCLEISHVRRLTNSREIPSVDVCFCDERCVRLICKTTS